MTRDELEFSITQYLDGTLDGPERAAVEARLADDAEARAMLAEEQALTDLLRSAPLPRVQWNRLAESISAAVDAHHEEEFARRIARASWALRRRLPAIVAVAASMLLVIGVTTRVLLRTAPRGGVRSRRATTAMLMVEGPQQEAPHGPAVMQISVGAGGSYARDASLSPYADEIDTRPASVVIAGSGSPTQQAVQFPY